VRPERPEQDPPTSESTSEKMIRNIIRITKRKRQPPSAATAHGTFDVV
jgi:hypothetical protein